MNNTNTRAIPWYFQFFVVIYTMHSTIPFVGYHTPAIVNVAVLFFLYGFLIVRNGQYALSDFIKTIPLFTIYLLTIIYAGFKNIFIEAYWILQLMIYPLIMLYIIRSNDRKVGLRILIIIGISLLVTSITTYLGCRAYPGASRELAAMLSSKDSALYAFYMSLNIGSFSFIYALVLLVPLLIYAIREKLIKRWIGLIVIVIVSMTIVQSDYTTALLCLLITIILLFLFPNQLKSKHYFIMAILTIVFMVASTRLVVPILNKVGELVAGEISSSRLQELSTFSSNEQSFLEGDMESRYELYMTSINSFANSPVYGGSSSKIGGHSYIFDNMGKFGLVGIIGMIMVYRTVYKRFYYPFRRQKWYGHVLFSFFMALLLALLNPKDNIIVLTFYLPLFCMTFAKNDIKYENTMDC